MNLTNFYLCVLDFEATCTDKNEFPLCLMEIIEFPSILYKVSDGDVALIGDFRKYVKPTIHPTLTTFCKNLTKITQKDVDDSDVFESVYKQHIKWLNINVPIGETLIFATCGHWDLTTMLPRELKNKKLKHNSIYKYYINVKDEFEYVYSKKAGSMTNMMEFLKIPFEGVLHSGYDDTKNISKIIIKIINDGHRKFRVNLLK